MKKYEAMAAEGKALLTEENQLQIKDFYELYLASNVGRNYNAINAIFDAYFMGAAAGYKQAQAEREI